MERKLLISKETIRDRVKKIADQISSDYREKDLVLVGVLNGVIFFFSDLLRAISIPTRMDFIRATSYGSQMTSSGTIRITKDIEIPVQGKSVIIVDDIVDTGLTMEYLIDKFEQKGVESLKVCALIDKSERRDISISIDYCGFQIKKGFIVGYGLDYDEKYRYLPDIYILR